jgi:RNA polymerase sigma-70 factor, ECF subfamily
MDSRADPIRWERLTRLLAPIHTQAVVTCRRLCRSADEGDDLYQETVLRAFEKLDGLRDESRFRSWFFAILLSRHRSRLRRARRAPVSIEGAFEPGREPAGEDGSEWDEERRRADRVARALSTLAPEQREAVVLFELEALSIEEVAAMQGVSVSAVKSRLARGREKLRRFYLRHGNEGESTPTAEARSARIRAVTAGALAPAEERSHE